MTVTSSMTPATRHRLKRSILNPLGKTRSLLLIVVATCGLLTATGLAASALADDNSQRAPKRCGYSEDDGWAFYNHCTTDGSNVLIKVDVVLGWDYHDCVEPGEHELGSSASIRNAWYTGDLCTP
jgi:hypothetical protein